MTSQYPGIIRKRIRFYGKVQKVGFRNYSVYKARILGLTGWVCNCCDGSVEMEVQGDPARINKLLMFLHSRMRIRIDAIEEKEIALKEETSFRKKEIV